MKTSTVRILGIYYIYVEKEKHSSFRFYAQGTLQQLHRYNCLSTTGHKQERPNKCRFKLILYTIPSYYKVCLTGVGSVKRQCTSDNETPIKRQEVNVPTYIDSTRECSPQKHEKNPLNPSITQEARCKTKYTRTISINYSNHRAGTVQSP